MLFVDESFGVAPAGRIYLDIGSSTGGFTDCLLQRGAARVHAVDVGRGQLSWKLRNHPRVVIHDRIEGQTLLKGNGCVCLRSIYLVTG